MPLHNIEYHTNYVYHATDENALFRQYRLSEGEEVSDMNESRSVLLYLAEGCLQVTLGNFIPRTIECGTLMFLPKNITFTGQAVGSCHLVASFFARQLPLYNKNLVNLQHEVHQLDSKYPPPENFHK